MRLLVLASADVVHARRWTAYFLERGHEVRLATLEPSEESLTGEIALPVRSRIQWLKYLLAAPALKELIRTFQPELVNAHFVSGYGFLAARVGSARPLAISVWGSDILLNPRRSPLHRLRTRYALRKAALVTCDAGVVSAALAKLGVCQGKILQVPMGIDPAVFHPPGNVSPPRAGKPLKIISTRRLEPIYGLPTALEAAAILNSRHIEFELTIVSEGSAKETLERRSRELGLEGRVIFRGALVQSELAAALREADIYLSASLSDSTSVSLLEAMGSGVFPVVSDIPGNREWVEDSRNGLLFPPGDPSALAGCLIRAGEEPGLRTNAAAISRELIQRKAIWKDNMRLVEDKFLELAEAGKKY